MDMKDIDKELRRTSIQEYSRLHRNSIWTKKIGGPRVDRIFKVIMWSFFILFWVAVACALVYAIAFSLEVQSVLIVVLGVVVSIISWVWSKATALFSLIFTWKGLILLGLFFIWLILWEIKQVLLDILRKMYD